MSPFSYTPRTEVAAAAVREIGVRAGRQVHRRAEPI